MSFTDYWEITNPNDMVGLWTKLIGSVEENHVETESQMDIILADMQKATTPTGRALEIGAGVGRLMKSLWRRGYFDEVHGVDPSISLVYLSQHYLNGDDGLSILLSDGLTLPYPNGHFDFVYSFTTFQHMMSLAMIHRNLVETKRVLRLGGTCRIQTIASGDKDPRDQQLFDGRVFHDVEDFAEQFRQAGLEVVATDSGLTHDSHIWVTAMNRS